ncbi:MAG: exodeoxyribonuclease VII small subunit [Deltaproteobacteria bacterium]|nr:exodeoxyribonuclease VII small subunit [Deltaproteobacteria bacterium]
MTDKKSHLTTKSLETFETGLKRLEAIVSDLENKELDLDAALKSFEEGVKLSQELSEKLKNADLKLQMLTKDPDGRPQYQQMEIPIDGQDSDDN